MTERIIDCDSTGRSVGLFGLLAILAEAADFFRNVLRTNDGGDIVGGILSDNSETAHFRECVAKWLTMEPELPPSGADRLSRCLEEAAGQVTEGDLTRLVNQFGKSVEHAGIRATTFCEIVEGLGGEYLDYFEQEYDSSDREQFVATLLRCDFAELSVEVSREFRILGKQLLDQPSDEPEKLPAAPEGEGTPVDEENDSPPFNVPRAVQYLIGWPEILDRIGQPDAAKDRIAQFNRDYSGPIITRQGAAPKVDAAELVVWWNGLKDRWREGAALTDEVSPELATYQHGRTETVVPEIGGHETKRVRGRNAK